MVRRQMFCLKRVSNNQALLESLISIFIEDTPAMINEIKQAMNTDNYDDDYFQKIFNNAHALKGVSGNLSGITLRQTSIKLEEAAKNNNQSEINNYSSRLMVDYQKLLTNLKNF